MRMEVLTSRAIERRSYWVGELARISGRFDDDTARMGTELEREIEKEGVSSLLDHLRLCGAIPESYGHDTSAEKLYSKYTDALLAATFRHLGMKSVVLSERADSADVEAFGKNFSLVADAKAFRLSRTAKNQKDFKIEALHSWKRGKPHALVVCPIYQFPTRTSQIYQQAVSRNVCILSYSHLSVLIQYSESTKPDKAEALLLRTLRCTENLNPTKDSIAYWTVVNRTMLEAGDAIRRLWQTEKLATVDAIGAAKEEALVAVARERENIARMSRDEAISALIKNRNLEGREKTIRSISDNGILVIS